jgi:hypothetical protein
LDGSYRLYQPCTKLQLKDKNGRNQNNSLTNGNYYKNTRFFSIVAVPFQVVQLQKSVEFTWEYSPHRRFHSTDDFHRSLVLAIKRFLFGRPSARIQMERMQSERECEQPVTRASNNENPRSTKTQPKQTDNERWRKKRPARRQSLHRRKPRRGKLTLQCPSVPTRRAIR